MGRRTIRAATLAAIAIVALSTAAVAADKLSPDDIKSTFGTGTPFGASTLGGKSFVMTFKTDGTATMVPKSRGAGQNGTWRVTDAGYCSKWGSSTERCYTVQKNGKRFDVLGSDGKVASHWTVTSVASAAPAPAAAKAPAPAKTAKSASKK